MTKFRIAVVVGILIVAGIWFLRRENSTLENPGTQTPDVTANQPTVPGAISSSNQSAVSSPVPGVAAATDLSARAGSPSATTAVSTNLEPLTVLDNARVVLHNYNAQFGENPIGSNPEITAALMGKNPKQINFISSESGLRVNQNGELLDGYGTPFFFHQISGKEMEIRSAGQDRKMWTYDDLTTR